MTREDIDKYYSGCLNTDDLREKVKYSSTNGYDESYESDLGIYWFKDFGIVIDVSHYYFVGRAK